MSKAQKWFNLYRPTSFNLLQIMSIMWVIYLHTFSSCLVSLKFFCISGIYALSNLILFSSIPCSVSLNFTISTFMRDKYPIAFDNPSVSFSLVVVVCAVEVPTLICCYFSTNRISISASIFCIWMFYSTFILNMFSLCFSRFPTSLVYGCLVVVDFNYFFSACISKLSS